MGAIAGEVQNPSSPQAWARPSQAQRLAVRQMVALRQIFHPQNQVFRPRNDLRKLAPEVRWWRWGYTGTCRRSRLH